MNSKYADSLITFKNSKPDEIPSYPQQVMVQARQQLSQCLNGMKQLNKVIKDNESLNEQQMTFLKGNMVIKIDTVYRLKRFMVISHESRCGRIQQHFWKFGGQIKRSELPNLHEMQKKYLINYKNLVNNYIEDVGIELTTDLKPPINTHVLVRVVRDCGEIVEHGITLQKNSVHYIKKKLVEKFIEKGDIVQIM